ncbi:MAG: aminotransferase class I/II-fold pyridoxal phosphate-dependent enzyme [Ignavibacteria bacterium]|nr:aminotransferase class I/II-fold pyridoxal phosphate-dependent enzyme [Ignavibacteria bacterium]
MKARRIEKIEDSIFGVMSALAFQYNAINLGQGFPDFSGPDWIIEAAYQAMKEGKNQYAPPFGIHSLRKIISNVYNKYYNIDFDIEKEITITAGATESLFSTILALVDEGDEVILFEPFYDAYLSDVYIAGGIPKFVTMHKPNFSFDFKELENAITPKTKAIIINNPNNPSGKVFTYEELITIYELAEKFNFYIISDEVYEFLTYDNHRHIPILTIDKEKKRSIMISSTGKTFSMTGWKIGWAIANPSITDAIRKVHQWTTFTINTPGQHAMAFAFSRIDDYLPEFKNEYQERRDIIFNELQKSIFKPHKPFGSYFIMVDIPTSNKDDIEIAKELTVHNNIATIPASPFYAKSSEGKTMLRICFAKTKETLMKGIQNLLSYKIQ